MEMCLGEKKEILKSIVEKKSKYQKVMVLFDNSVSEIFLREIYEEIKDICVYNQIHIADVGEEIYDGYRLVVYVCEVNSFLNVNIKTEEFVNVFMSQDNCFLPYFLNQQSCLKQDENYLVLDSVKIDLYMLSSVYFNCYFNSFKNLIEGEEPCEILGLSNYIFTQENLIQMIKSMKEKTFFVDVDIIKKSNIEYEKLILIDLLIVDSILLFLSTLKSDNLMLVDVYKSAKDDEELIDKFYKLYQNDKVIELLGLNFNYLYNLGLKTKNKLVEILSYNKFEKQEIDCLISKIKEYSKKDSGAMGYLYLYNIFNV